MHASLHGSDTDLKLEQVTDDICTLTAACVKCQEQSGTNDQPVVVLISPTCRTDVVAALLAMKHSEACTCPSFCAANVLAPADRKHCDQNIVTTKFCKREAAIMQQAFTSCHVKCPPELFSL